MTEPIAYQPQTVLPFVNRSGFLIAAGVLMLLAGIMTGCGMLSMPLALVMPQQPGVQQVTPDQVVAAVAVYAVLTTLLAWIGVGLLMRRRWARPLAMIVATHWVIVGILSVIGSIALLPFTRDLMGNLPNVPPGFVTVMLIVGIAFSTLFFVALPAVILWLVKSEDVRLTVEHFDPKTRWTDRCPLKVLGLSITLWLAGVLFLSGLLYGMFPIGGVLLRGWPAAVVTVVIAALLMLAGYLSYKLDMRGWWLGVLTITGVTLAMIPSTLLVSPVKTYRAFGTPEEQLRIVAEHEQLLKLSFAGFLILFAVSFAIYMFRLRPVMLAARSSQTPTTSLG